MTTDKYTEEVRFLSGIADNPNDLLGSAFRK